MYIYNIYICVGVCVQNAKLITSIIFSPSTRFFYFLVALVKKELSKETAKF